jgi:hypothetical protein
MKYLFLYNPDLLCYSVSAQNGSGGNSVSGFFFIDFQKTMQRPLMHLVKMRGVKKTI